uniref:Uncharacterized protein n=1 Tax=Poecilia reticulata TaxID=8081 RepID=A0A3P9NHE6_POERE
LKRRRGGDVLPPTPTHIFRPCLCITVTAYAKKEQNKDYKRRRLSFVFFGLFHLFFSNHRPLSLHEPRRLTSSRKPGVVGSFSRTSIIKKILTNG